MVTEILVVDDSAAELIFIEHFLRKDSEFNVQVASSGAEALKLVEKFRPEIIVSDLHMPGMSGLDLVRGLRDASHDIPVVLMTSSGSEDIAIKALRAGAASYVPKRVIDTELVKTLRKVISLTNRRKNRRRHLENMTMLESHSVLENDDASLTNFVSYVLDHAVQMRLLRGQEVTQVGIALQEVLVTAIYEGNLGLDSRMRHVDESEYFELANLRRAQLPYAERRLNVEVKLDRSMLRFVVKHQGDRCDATEISNVTEQSSMDRIHERSQTLINTFMDSVSYNPALNQITLIKYVTIPSAECDGSLISEKDAEQIQNLKSPAGTQPLNNGRCFGLAPMKVESR